MVLEDRILLFDYKTDHYKVPSQLVERYRDQLDLYAEALRRSYGKEQVEKYLVLLGGPPSRSDERWSKSWQLHRKTSNGSKEWKVI